SSRTSATPGRCCCWSGTSTPTSRPTAPTARRCAAWRSGSTTTTPSGTRRAPAASPSSTQTARRTRSAWDRASRCCAPSAGRRPQRPPRPRSGSAYVPQRPATPLGVGSDGPIVRREVDVEDGTLLFLYTDGLVENRARDIDDGLARLRPTFGPGAAARPLEDLCQTALDGVYDDQHRDDIAMLVARLARIPDRKSTRL